MQKRQELIVDLYSTKYMTKLKHYGFVHYVSKKMKYAIIYVNLEDADRLAKEIKDLSFVRNVKFSPKHQINMDFSNVLEELRQSIQRKNKEENLCES